MALKRKKEAKVDMSKASLPKTRKELFSFLFKNNRRTLFTTGVMLILFALPIFACFILSSVLSNVLYQDYAAKASQVSGEELEALKATYTSSYIMYTDIFSWVLVIALVIFAIGLSGIFCVMRDFSYNEPTYFRYSFKKGIKQNIGQFILIFIIAGLVHVLAMHMLIIDGNALLRALPMALFLVVVLPIAILMCYISTIYKEGYFTILMLAIRFYIGKIYLILPLGLMVMLPYALLYMPYFVSFFSISICYPVLAILIIALCPILLLIYFLCLHNIFDKTINKKNYPDIVGKGLINN